MTTAPDILRRLLAVTPEPPDVAPEELLAIFDAMHAARAEILASLDHGPVPRERAILDELVRRDVAWLDALEHARGEVGRQRSLVTKLRAYAP